MPVCGYWRTQHPLSDCARIQAASRHEDRFCAVRASQFKPRLCRESLPVQRLQHVLDAGQLGARSAPGGGGSRRADLFPGREVDDARPALGKQLGERFAAASTSARHGFRKMTSARPVRQLCGSNLSCVRVSKSPASWRSCSWLWGSPQVRFTMRPRLTAGRLAIVSAHRLT